VKRIPFILFSMILIMYSCIGNTSVETSIRSTMTNSTIANNTRYIQSINMSSTSTISQIQEYSPTLSLTIDNKMTSTPASLKKCPITQTDVPLPDFESGTFEKQVIDYLNEGGNLEALETQLNQYEKRAVIMDLTNDGIPEISIYIQRAYIFGCINGEYRTLLIVEPRKYRVEVIGIIDMNADGTPELVYKNETHGATGDSKAYYSIFEWNGNRFANLITDRTIYSEKVDGGGSNKEAWMFNGYDILQDIDNNGTIELILYGGNDGGLSACDSGPVRNETHIWMWNGNEFDLASMELDPPEYRFQVVFDGDEASLAGDYIKAEKLYTLAITDDTLYGIENFFGERPNLTAYSKYRILLIYILTDNKSSEEVYQSIQVEFPVGMYGHAYSELANVVWDEYNQSKNIGIACNLVIKYAETHQVEILQPLGAGEYAYYGYGKQNNSYVAYDICPFS
jgi:hypothetical protein